jgi:DNA-binding winged helix-turn-helix (wHTH) protein/predicted ATPase
MRYAFGDCILDTQRYEFGRAGQPLKLQPKVFDLLVYLVQHRDRVIPRRELFTTLWPDPFVSEDALERLIVVVRRAVGDSGQAQRVIKTIHGRGYRFVAPVEERSQGVSAEQPCPALAGEDAGTGRTLALAPLDGERKLATVLTCAWLLPETSLAGVDPETLHTSRQAFFTLAQQEVRSYAGTIQHFADKGFLAFFGAPMAYEDHPQRAVLAALSIQERLGDRRDGAGPLSYGVRAVRMGVHTGQVVVSTLGADQQQIILGLGDTIPVAEQLLSLAEPGMIVLSETTGRVVQPYVHLERIGPVHVQGATTPYTAYQALARLPQPVMGWRGRRVARRFVGRDSDMGTLHALLAQVEARRGQVVGITGEPGIGKSRLLYEFYQQVQQKALTYLEGRCISYGQATPYLPLLDLVRRVCGLTENDTPEATAGRVSQYLQRIGLEPEAHVPYILRLLNLPDRIAPVGPLGPQELRTRIFATLLQMQLATSWQRPLLLVVEDAHWIDPTSEEWLLALVDKLINAPILLLLSYRSGYQPAWIGKSYATQLALQRLTADESQQIVRTALPPLTVSDDLVQTIVTRGEGNPFFLEELAQTVADHGDSFCTLALPETVQAVLTARLDRLPPEAKALAQVAAVIGVEVPWGLLQAVTAIADTALQHHLAPLRDAELFYEVRSIPEPIYAFKHALTHEVTYHSLLRSTRQHYHQQIAEVLVGRFADRAETQPEVVAHHYTEAGLYEQALLYWQQAGERAARRSAHREALMHCARGLAVLAMLPETRERAAHELRLQVALGFAHMGAAGPAAPSTAHAFERALELCPQVADPLYTLMALRGLSTVALYQEHLQPAQALAERLLCLSHQVGDRVHSHKAHLRLGRIAFYRGDLQAARTHEEQALMLALPPHDGNSRDMGSGMGVDARAILASCLWHLGYPDQARACVQVSLTLTCTHPHPMSRVQALAQAAQIHAFCGAWPAVQTHADALVTLASDHGFAWNRLYALYYRGLALVAQGYTAAGLAEMQQGMAALQSHGAPLHLSFQAGLAEAYGWSGEIKAGLALLAEALAHLQASGGHVAASRLYRLQGELLLTLSPEQQEEAERCFHHALAVARQQQARGLELRAALCLSRLWQRHGQRDAARQVLAEVYGWFTEGFDTADLQEAKGLLHELE